MSKAALGEETLETAVTELSRATAQLLRRARTVSDPDELGWGQLAILARLDSGGPATTAELARAESMKPQSMGTMVAMLWEEGLVERQPHPTDGRQVLIALTPAGTEARKQRRLVKRRWLLSAMATLSPAEQRTLLEASALIRRLAET
jgi:DNA-binding MarR family transcriptional regulator